MDALYAVCFWFVFLGLPAALVGLHHRSWRRAFAATISVSTVPFACAVGLALLGGPLGFRTPEEIEAWEALAIGVGGSFGYLLGILLPFARFSRSRGPQKSLPDEPGPLLVDPGRARVAAGG